MRTKSTGGFTLIELLIVIAIIGILAAVLIPNLMNARTTAQERAAQAYSSNVYTAAIAALADNVRWTPAQIGVDGEQGDGACLGIEEATAITGGEDSGTDSAYTINPTPAGVTGCDIAVNATSGELEVTVTTANGSYMNGVEQD